MLEILKGGSILFFEPIYQKRPHVSIGERSGESVALEKRGTLPKVCLKVGAERGGALSLETPVVAVISFCIVHLEGDLILIFQFTFHDL